MIFRAELAEKVLAGEKIVTRRLVSANPRSPWSRTSRVYQPGKEFAVQPGRGKPSIGRAVVTHALLHPIGYLNHEQALSEGFGSVTLFMLAFMQLNGWHSYDEKALIWRIKFEVVGSARAPSGD